MQRVDGKIGGLLQFDLFPLFLSQCYEFLWEWLIHHPGRLLMTSVSRYLSSGRMLLRSKGYAQRLSAFLSRLLTFISKWLQAEEPVNHAVIAGDSDGHTRLFEPLAVGFALVAQRVILACNNQGRR